MVFSLSLSVFWTLTTSAVTLNITDDELLKLSNDLERDIPGSVDWLHRWAIDEQILEELVAIVDGRKSIPETTRPAAIAAFLFSLNPEIPLVVFMDIMVRIFAHHTPVIPTHELVQLYFRLEASKAIPDWLYQHLTKTTSAGLSKDLIFASSMEMISTMKDDGIVDPRDIRFSQRKKQVQAYLAPWVLTGVSNSDRDRLIVHNAETWECFLRKEFQSHNFQRIALLTYS